jgi:hypothetical protein
VRTPVKGRNLIAVPIKLKGSVGRPDEFTEAPLRGLAPTRVIYGRIHVRIETVWFADVPSGGGLLLQQLD